MLKVAYDISQLGLGDSAPGNRTGIYRVVEHLAFGLAAHDDIALKFTAAESIDLWGKSASYLRKQPRLAHIKLTGSPGRRELIVRALNREVDMLGRRPRRGIANRALRKLAFMSSRAVSRGGVSLRVEDLCGMDVFHAPASPLPPVTAHVRGLRRFVTIYDLIPLRLPHLVADASSQLLKAVLASVRPGDTVFTISQWSRNDICDYLSVNPERMLVTYPAADPDLFFPCSDERLISQVRSRYGIPEGRYILALNTLDPRKNMERLIRAFANLVAQERLGDVHLVLAGAQGWAHHKLLHLLERLRLSNGVVLAGYVADADLAPLYSGAEVFMFPSLAEGFGLPPLEAMQCGTPVITSNTTSLPEVVGDAGILVDPGDPDALSQALLALLEDPSLRETLSRRAVARAGTFSWERCTEETIRGYRTAFS